MKGGTNKLYLGHGNCTPPSTRYRNYSRNLSLNDAVYQRPCISEEYSEDLGCENADNGITATSDDPIF